MNLINRLLHRFAGSDSDTNREVERAAREHPDRYRRVGRQLVCTRADGIGRDIRDAFVQASTRSHDEG